MEVITAVVAWTVCRTFPTTPWINGLCARSVSVDDLQQQLSSSARVYLPASKDYPVVATRWSTANSPSPNVIVVPGSESDVVEIVKYANAKNLPFVTYNGGHGAQTKLGQMSHGIGISLSQLDSVEIAENGKSAIIGGGALSKKVIDTLWESGKQTVTGTCECVSLLGPGLGGGHGWLQGHYGLIADQFLSMNVVLADGSLQQIDSSSELWWAMKGAGHNFGIVTSVQTKIHHTQHHDWAIETFIFSGAQVESVYQAANEYILKNGSQPAEVINWSYWLNIPQLDADNPVIIFYIIQEGVRVVDPAYTKPFHDLNPLSVEPRHGTYTDLAAWTLIDTSAIPCQKLGRANFRFPIYLDSYNVNAQREVYDQFATAVRGSSPFNNSIFLLEGYPTEGIRTQSSGESAFAFREDNLLLAPLINYVPDGPSRDRQAAEIGNRLRSTLHEATGREHLRTYVNYAHGEETPTELYGAEIWRQDKLRNLKRKYDPARRFSFYGPIA